MNNKKAISDANGEFHFTGVGYGEDLQLHIDDSTLDLNLKPEENPMYFHAEKGGKTHIEVRVNKSFGVDGIVTAPYSFSGWHVNFYHEETSRTFSAKVEQDGFYFFEDLIPGDYRIVIEDNETEVETRARIRSEDWVSGLNFVVYKLHKNAKPVLQVVFKPVVCDQSCTFNRPLSPYAFRYIFLSISGLTDILPRIQVDPSILSLNNRFLK